MECCEGELGGEGGDEEGVVNGGMRRKGMACRVREVQYMNEGVDSKGVTATLPAF